MMADATHTHAVIVGAGIMGLSVAEHLLSLRGGRRRRPARVTIVAEHRTPDTTSDGAGALWRPVMVQGDAVRAWSIETFNALRARAAAPGDGTVAFVTGTELLEERAREDPPFAADVLGWRRLTPAELAAHNAAAGRAGGRPPPHADDAQQQHGPFLDGWRYTSIMFNPPAFLRALSARVEALGAEFVRARVASLAEAVALALGSGGGGGGGGNGGVRVAVANCAGLGAGALAGDATVYPIRGQTVKFVAPPPTGAHGIGEFVVAFGPNETPLTYVLPRPGGGAVVLGGTAEEGRGDGGNDPAAMRALVARCRRLCPALDAALAARRASDGALQGWAGLRPGRREGIRLEAEEMGPLRVVHCYGHGGSGLTLHVGCARAAAALVRAALGLLDDDGRSKL